MWNLAHCYAFSLRWDGRCLSIFLLVISWQCRDEAFASLSLCPHGRSYISVLFWFSDVRTKYPTFVCDTFNYIFLWKESLCFYSDSTYICIRSPTDNEQALAPAMVSNRKGYITPYGVTNRYYVNKIAASCNPRQDQVSSCYVVSVFSLLI